MDIQTVLMGAATERKARKSANCQLQLLTSNRYHDGLPLTQIDEILTTNNFSALESAIYCGRDGVAHEQVGSRTWIMFSWHKMESGRYEVVAYVS